MMLTSRRHPIKCILLMPRRIAETPKAAPVMKTKSPTKPPNGLNKSENKDTKIIKIPKITIESFE